MRITNFVCGTLMFCLIGVVSADVWTDPFDGTELAEGWEFRDHNTKKTTFEVKDSFLQMTNPGYFQHTTPDKPMLEREVPKSAAKKITVSGIFTTEPDKPANAWMGIFLYSDDDLNYACILFGGEAGQPQQTLIGSMVQGHWQDKGHFQTGFNVPLHLKIVKEDDVFAGYYRENEKDEWTLAGGKTWNHKFDVERVGIGFMNNWNWNRSGLRVQTVTFLVDTLSIDGTGIEPFTVARRLATGDVNRDGQVSILDMILVAQHLGEDVSANPQADVNQDGTINIQDLLVVAQHLGESTVSGAPTVIAAINNGELTPTMIQAWIEQAEAADDGSLTFREGIATLQRLLAEFIPEETVLLQNYPNPFNPETWLPYQLARHADVTLTIYAVNGQVVRTLALGHQTAGVYQSKVRAAYWDGQNAVGEPVTSGVYFYRLTAGEFTATRKLLIRK